MIYNPQNDLEDRFFFPIATEHVYSKYWSKFADQNNLLWLKALQFGFVIEREYFDDVKNELNIFLVYLEKDKDENEHLIERVYLFLSKLEEAKLIRDDISLFVG